METVLPHRSYCIRTEDGTVVWRNCQHLRETKEQYASWMITKVRERTKRPDAHHSRESGNAKDPADNTKHQLKKQELQTTHTSPEADARASHHQDLETMSKVNH